MRWINWVDLQDGWLKRTGNHQAPRSLFVLFMADRQSMRYVVPCKTGSASHAVVCTHLKLYFTSHGKGLALTIRFSTRTPREQGKELNTFRSSVGCMFLVFRPQNQRPWAFRIFWDRSKIFCIVMPCFRLDQLWSWVKTPYPPQSPLK